MRLTKAQAILFARYLVVALFDELDEVCVFRKAWLDGLSDDVILGVVTRGEPLPEWTGPSVPSL